MRTSRRIGIEIDSRMVREICLDHDERVLARAERGIEGPGGAAAALGELSAELGAPGRVQLLVSGLGERFVQFHLPRLRGVRLRQAIRRRAEQELDGELADFLWGASADVGPTGGTTVVSVLALPREPLESWCGLLAFADQRVAGIHSPLSLLLGGAAGDEARVDLLEGETRIALISGGIVAASEILPRIEGTGRDPLRTIEQRHREAAAIRRIAGDSAARILLRGPAALARPLSAELAAAGPQGPPVIVRDPWEGLADVPDAGEEVMLRYSAALTAARSPDRSLAPVPASTRKHRDEGRRLGLAAAGILLLALGCAAGAFALGQQRARLIERRDDALTRLSRPLPGRTGAKDRVEEQHQPSTRDWSELLREAGLIARPGIDYDRLVLDISSGEPTLGLEGSAAAGDPRETAMLLATLHGELMRTPLGRGLPRLAAEGGMEAGDRLRFALERKVRLPEAREQ